MNKYIIYIISFLFVFSGIAVRAQQDIVPAKEKIELRIPDKEKIEKYKEDKSFNYESKKPVKTPQWLQRIYEKLRNLFGRTAEVILSREVGLILLIVVLTAIIVTLALRSQNLSFKSLFGKRKMGTDDADFITEDVNQMDFDQLIQENLKAKNYRLAVRFLYLKNLKALSDKSIINWNPNKTNYSYRFEIENDTLRSRFLDTTRIFDFVWYGEFVLDDSNFQDAYNYFNEFNQLIKNER